MQITGNPILSLNSTILGEGYGNFGPFALIVIPLSLLLIEQFFIRMRAGLTGKYYGFAVAFGMWRFDYSFGVIAAFVLFILLKIEWSRVRGYSTPSSLTSQRGAALSQRYGRAANVRNMKGLPARTEPEI